MNYLARAAERIRHALPPGTEPPPDSEDLFLLYAVLLRTKGVDTTARDVHDAWSAWASVHEPGHESIRPYEELPQSVRSEDEPFASAIRRCAAEDAAH